MEKQVYRNKESNKLNRNNKYFILFLMYSLLPGIYKIVDNQLMMLGSIPIIFFLLYDNRKMIKYYKHDMLFLFLFFYILLQTICWFFFPTTNKIGLAMGLYMNILPMLGYFIAKTIKFETFSKILLKVILVHCILGIILYLPFGITNKSIPIVNILTEGVAFGRMASVSGSLGFGNLLMIGFILSFFTDKRYLLLMSICLLFSLQRSAWLGGFFAIFLYLIYLIKQFEVTKIFSFSIILVFLFVSFIVISDKYINIDLSFAMSRFESINDATSERKNQWENGIENFLAYPLGVGSGQAGQFAARYNEAQSIFKAIPDGDYFRSLSEYGIMAAIFFIFVIISYIISIISISFKSKKDIAIIALIGGELIQMIGSNVSEFYFTNFIYWMIFGYYFTFIGNNYSLNLGNKKQNDICLHSNI